MVCVDARQAKAALSGRPNKSDELDAECLAQLARTGLYANVRVKRLDNRRLRSVLVGRAKLVGMKRTLSSTIRSLLKTFGLFARRARGKGFADRVRELMADEPLLGKGIEGLPVSWETVSRQVRLLDRLLSGLARRAMLRGYLFEAATVALSRVPRENAPVTWPASWRWSCSPCGARTSRSAGRRKSPRPWQWRRRSR